MWVRSSLRWFNVAGVLGVCVLNERLGVFLVVVPTTDSLVPEASLRRGHQSPALRGAPIGWSHAWVSHLS